MELTQLKAKLEQLQGKKDKLKNDIKEINKRAKEEVASKKSLVSDIDKEIYVKELEIFKAENS